MTFLEKLSHTPSSSASEAPLQAGREADYEPIENYAAIGDCSSLALVGKSGSIDWLCWPRFDSPTMFGALLDPERGGRFTVRPAERAHMQRWYVDETNVLTTRFEAPSGVLELTDFMPVSDKGAFANELRPDHEIVRQIRCTDGTMRVRIHCDPRFDYGRKHVPPRRLDAGAFSYDNGSMLLKLFSQVPLAQDEGGGLSGQANLEAGQQLWLSLSCDTEVPGCYPVVAEDGPRRLSESVAFWRRWAARCSYKGPYSKEVRRSALALKMLTFSKSGAVVAAPTASLPECIGAERNWDYRFCWIRDAAFALRSLLNLGYYQEAESFFSWILHATRATAPEVKVLYNVYGNSDLGEKELNHLRGYRDSRPVRIGNGAAEQTQLDLYGILLEAAYEYVRRGRTFERWERRFLEKLGQVVHQRWQDKGHGLWEIRNEKERQTTSQAFLWTAAESLVRLHEEGEIRIEPDRCQRLKDDISSAIEHRAYCLRNHSYVSFFDKEAIDASLLLLVTMGYASPTSERMKRTVQRIEEELGAGGGLLYRYGSDLDDGLSSGEGAFLACSFWLVEVYAMRGDTERAHDLMKTLLDYTNDVGLLSEEIDPKTGAFLGNFPQGLSHSGFINAAVTLEEAEAPGAAHVGPELARTETGGRSQDG